MWERRRISTLLDPEQLPVLQVWIHGVASTHLPQPAPGPPGWISDMCGLVRLLLAWLGGWGCMGRLAAPVPAWAGSRGHTGPTLLRTRRSWVWNQFFVIEEYSGPEPVLIGKVRINPSCVYTLGPAQQLHHSAMTLVPWHP